MANPDLSVAEEVVGPEEPAAGLEQRRDVPERERVLGVVDDVEEDVERRRRVERSRLELHFVERPTDVASQEARAGKRSREPGDRDLGQVEAGDPGAQRSHRST